MNDEQRYQQGITVRTEVLGEKHVGRSLENLNDFNADFQNFISFLPARKVKSWKKQTQKSTVEKKNTRQP